jgi:hypothetical protein
MHLRKVGLPSASPTGEQRLAAAVVTDALKRARQGDSVERRWLTTPRRLAMWAGVLGTTGDRLAGLARDALRRRRDAEGWEE